jgi:glycine betaine/choline ABC-type transport system substrate-binding protein
MDLSLIYRALADRQVDLVAGDATSGLIDAYGLVMLEDNRRYFPPYDAVTLARSATLLAHPEVRHALTALAGQVSVSDMRGMNRAVDTDRRDPADVVRAFLARRH